MGRWGLLCVAGPGCVVHRVCARANKAVGFRVVFYSIIVALELVSEVTHIGYRYIIARRFVYKIKWRL